MDAMSNSFGNTSVVFGAPVEHKVLNTIVATLQGWIGEQGHPNHISPCTCVGGEP